MKEQNFSFLGTDVILKGQSNKGGRSRVFDWDKAAVIIKERLSEHPDLVAEAGLRSDWEYTGVVIFKRGFPVNSEYTYLSSNWATPAIVLSWGGEDQEDIECWSFKDETRFNKDSKWDEQSLGILGINVTLVTD